jgi:predicted nucleic acid-binding protein
MKVFLDTPVIFSATAVRGLCADVLREVLAYHELILSIPVIAELNTVLVSQLNLPDDIITESIGFLYEDALVSERFQHVDIDINDKEDIPILSSALNGRAELFVTGDNEILQFRKINDMEIVSPRKFWEKVKDEPKESRSVLKGIL